MTETNNPIFEINLGENLIEIELPGGARGLKGNPGDTGPQGFSPTITSSKTGKTTTLTITDVNGTRTATILDGEDGEGSGDMNTSVYDVNRNGIVDNAELVNGHSVNADVPTNAKFTDTTYKSITNAEIDSIFENDSLTPIVETKFLDYNGLAYYDNKLQSKIGDLDDLPTTSKESVVSAITEINGLIGDITSALDLINGEVV